jgi:mono/diheme cytochrome c family protein
MKTLVTVAVTLLVLLVLAIGYAWSGAYDVGADAPHSRPVHAMLETLRERSIATRSDDLAPPDLTNEELISSGAGNYDAMCVGCHLAPGMNETELSKGLYPQPPNLSRVVIDDAAEAFWAIKHGIKASGMPAWGTSMEDAYIWNMAAFLQVLPGLDAAEYGAMVARSGGHDHGGGETAPHDPQADEASVPGGDVEAPDAPAPARNQRVAEAPAPPRPEAATYRDATQDAARPATEPHDHHAHEH